MTTLNFNIRRLSVGALCLLALTNCNKNWTSRPKQRCRMPTFGKHRPT